MKTDKTVNIAAIITLILILSVLAFVVYMKATSYECVVELPAKKLVGPENSTRTVTCTGGILAKFPIKEEVEK